MDNQFNKEELARLQLCVIHEIEKKKVERATMGDGMMLAQRFRYEGCLLALKQKIDALMGF